MVRRLLIEETLPIEKELYLGILVDRGEGKPVFMASAAGGMDIEQVAAENPDAILKEYIDPGMGLEAFQARKIAFQLGLKPQLINQAVQFMTGLYKAFLEDRRLAGGDQSFHHHDRRPPVRARCQDQLRRQRDVPAPDLRELRDITEEDPLEVEASKYNLNYIKLDGSVGCMVNGAGLAMATMDIIKYAGGMPANFLDVGGGANAEQVTHAFEILLSDKNVKAVLINIFGGILRVDTLATGVVEAAQQDPYPAADRAAAGRNERRGRAADSKGVGIEFHRGGDDEGRGGKSSSGRKGSLVTVAARLRPADG